MQVNARPPQRVTMSAEQSDSTVEKLLPVLSSTLLAQRFSMPPGKVYLLYGDEPIFKLSMHIASCAVEKGMNVGIADGGNQFNVHAITRFAQQWNHDPDKFLHHIFVSRSFTCYQMEQTVVHRLPQFLRQSRSHTAILLGLLDTFYDEQVPLREARHILQRVLTALWEMKSVGVSILVTCANRTVWPEERNQLFTILKNSVDRAYRLDMGQVEESQLFQVEYEKPSLVHHTQKECPQLALL